jgi:MFS family permease
MSEAGRRQSPPSPSDSRAADTTEAPQPASDSIYGRGFWLLFIATFALNFAANMFVLFPLFIVGLGGGATSIGAIVGTASLFALLARPYAGVAIDRRGRRITAFWAMLLDVGALSLYLPIRTIGLPIFAVRAIHGAVEGTARVALFAIVFDVIPESRRGEGMAIFSICGMGSAIIAPLVAEVLIRRVGFTAFFATAMALAATGAMLTLKLPGDRPHRAGEHHEAPSGASYAQLLNDAGLRPLWIVTLLFSLALSPRLSFVAPFAVERGIATVGGYFAIYSTAAVITRIAGGRMLDRIGFGRVLVPSMAVLGFGLALIAGTGRTGVLSLAALIGGLGHGSVYPALSAMVIARTEANAMGRSSSIYTSLYDVGSMTGPYLLGMIGEYLGYPPLFVVAGAIALGGAVFFAVAEPSSLTKKLA